MLYNQEEEQEQADHPAVPDDNQGDEGGDGVLRNHRNDSDDAATSDEQPQEDPTMTISDTERQNALALKRALLDSNDEELEGVALSDMEYVQHAIVARGDLKEALLRISRIHSFQRHYKVNHTVEQARELLLGLMAQQPGFLLHLDVDPETHDSINVIDLGSFNPTIATAVSSKGVDSNWRTWVGGIYYMKYCSQPTIQTIRNGFFALADFGDLTSDNFSVEAQHRLFEEVLGCFPYIWKHFLAYNTNVIANISLTLAKQLMPHNMKNSLQLGCQIVENDEACSPTSRLRDFYLVPSLEEAQKRALERALELLEQRIVNESKFRL